MIAETLGQMYHRRCKGKALERQDRDLLDKNLTEVKGEEILAGAMAKATAPRNHTEKT